MEDACCISRPLCPIIKHKRQQQWELLPTVVEFSTSIREVLCEKRLVLTCSDERKGCFAEMNKGWRGGKLEKMWTIAVFRGRRLKEKLSAFFEGWNGKILGKNKGFCRGNLGKSWENTTIFGQNVESWIFLKTCSGDKYCISPSLLSSEAHHSTEHDLWF